MVQVERLLKQAKQASQRAYAPYSQLKVGAALLTKTGECFLGCNVENSSFGATICAERVAICNAVSQGFTNFAALAIVNDSDKIITPCGICRQFLREFTQDVEIYCGNDKLKYKKYTLKQLFPDEFTLDQVKKKSEN